VLRLPIDMGTGAAGIATRARDRRRVCSTDNLIQPAHVVQQLVLVGLELCHLQAILIALILHLLQRRLCLAQDLVASRDLLL